jgi:hypothetical protein
MEFGRQKNEGFLKLEEDKRKKIGRSSKNVIYEAIPRLLSQPEASNSAS